MMQSNHRPAPARRDLPGRVTEDRRGIPRTKGEKIISLGLFAILVAVLAWLYPSRQRVEYSAFEQGAIALAEVIAPETFDIQKNESEYAREAAAVRNRIPPLLVFDPTISSQQKTGLNSLFHDLTVQSDTKLPDAVKVHQLRISHPGIAPVSESTIQYLLFLASSGGKRLGELRKASEDLLSTGYGSGILSGKAEIVGEDGGWITVLEGEGERLMEANAIRDLDAFKLTFPEEIAASLRKPSPGDVKAAYELVAAYLMPNFLYDATETERRRSRAEANVSRTKGTVLKGERIIDKHERVTAQHADKLSSLAKHLNERLQKDPYVTVLQAGARVVLIALLVGIFFAFIKLSKPSVYRQTSSIALFGILILMPALVASQVAANDSITPLLVPIALSAMLATVLFDVEIGLLVSLLGAAICSNLLGSLPLMLVYLIVGILGAFSVHRVLRRSDFYLSVVYLVGAYTLSITATGLLQFEYTNVSDFLDKIRWDILFGILAACASTVLTIGLLPIFESVFNVVTPITLLELSDLNRPLLRNLAIRAPGTYSHSIIMASLSEAAASAIGANPLLVRIGCYYHDIGKMTRPHYFIENQKGVNPHDGLQPKMSALILISHVREGVEIAEDEGLPRAITDLIPQHHGTSEIASFKHRALERGDKQTVRDEDYRYPGPKPQTKEAGIVNLADAVESATRTLRSPTPDRIKGMVQTLVKGRFTAGELDECELTLGDLNKIQMAFLPILQATRHARVAYPWQERQKRGAKGRRRPDAARKRR